jgi:hypothetical protein
MDTWNIHIGQRLPNVDPIKHIQTQSGKETYTFKSTDFLITDHILDQIEKHVMGWFQTGLKDGPHTHAWRLVGKIFLHWPTFKHKDFENPICVLHQDDQYKVMTGITRLWARCLHTPSYNKTKALIFHRDPNFGKNRIDTIADTQDLFLNPVNDMLISVDYWSRTECYFINEFDSLDRRHMNLFTGKGNSMKEFEKYWKMLHETSRELGLPKYSREHIIQGTKLLLGRI